MTGVSQMRVHGDGGGELPNARHVSTVINNIEVHVPSRSSSYMVMQYGQFLDHDMSHTDAATTTVINPRNGRGQWRAAWR